MNALLLPILMLLALPQAAFSQPKAQKKHAVLPKLALPESCPSAREMDPYIKMCGQNRFLAIQARYCAEELVASWKLAAAAVLPILQSRGQSGRQDLSEDDTRRNYADVIRVISGQLRLMRHYASVIERYPAVMIDLPGSTGDATSLSCFNEAFHQVQEVLSFLDDEIIRAKGVRDSATALMNLASGRHQSLSGSLGQEGARTRGVKGVSGRGSPRSFSTITGEIHEAMRSSDQATAKLSRSVPGSGEGPPPFVAKRGPRGERAGILASFTDSDLFATDSRVTAASQGASWKGESSAKALPAPADSVGAVLWREGEGRMKLSAVPGSVNARPERVRATRFQVAALVGPKGVVEGLRRAPAGGPESTTPKRIGSQEPLYQQDADLFRAVSRRYRSTELFRSAR